MKNSKKPHNRDKAGHKNKKPSQKGAKGQKVKIDLFGTHAVAEAWTNPKRHIHTLYVTDNALDGFDTALKKAHDLGLTRPAPQIVDKAVLDGSTPPGSVHQGIGLNCQPLEGVDIHDIMRADDLKNRSLLVMLDQVTDPHNVGAIIRSACVFGATGIIMQKKHAPELTGILAKTACGGIEHIPVAYETNLTRTLEALQKEAYFAVGLDERGTQPLSDLKNYQKLVIVMGAEGPGLRRLVKEQCDALTALPTAGPISSLNVSNATAVTLFAASQS